MFDSNAGPVFELDQQEVYRRRLFEEPEGGNGLAGLAAHSDTVMDSSSQYPVGRDCDDDGSRQDGLVKRDPRRPAGTGAGVSGEASGVAQVARDSQKYDASQELAGQATLKAQQRDLQRHFDDLQAPPQQQLHGQQQQQQQVRWSPLSAVSFQTQLRQYQQDAMAVQQRQPQPSGAGAGAVDRGSAGSSISAASTAQYNGKHGAAESCTAAQHQHQQPSYILQREPVGFGGNRGGDSQTQQDSLYQRGLPSQSAHQQQGCDASFSHSLGEAAYGMQGSVSSANGQPNGSSSNGQSNQPFINAHDFAYTGESQNGSHPSPAASHGQQSNLDATHMWGPSSGASSPGLSLFANPRGQPQTNPYSYLDGHMSNSDSSSQPYPAWQLQKQPDQGSAHNGYANTYSTHETQTISNESFNRQMDALRSSFANETEGLDFSSQTQTHQNGSYNGYTDYLQPHTALQQQPQQQQHTNLQPHSYPGTAGEYLSAEHFALPAKYYPTLHYDYGKPVTTKADSFLQTTMGSPIEADASSHSGGSASDNSAVSRGQKRDRPSARSTAHKSSSSITSSRRSSVPSLAGGAGNPPDGFLINGDGGTSKHTSKGDREQHASGMDTSADSRPAPFHETTSVETVEQRKSRPIAGRCGRHDRVPSLSRLQLEQVPAVSVDQMDSVMAAEPSVLAGPPYFTGSVLPSPQSTESEQDAHERLLPTKSTRQSSKDAKRNEEVAQAASSASDASASGQGGGRRMYECQVCGRKFPRPSALTVHERIHSGEKPFNCEECGRPFTVASNLRRHQKIHAKQSRNHANDIGPALTIQESESSTIKQPPAARLKMDLTPVPASDEEDAGEEPLDVDEEVESMYEADAASLSSRGSDPLARTPSLDSSASGASHSSTRKMPVTAF